MNQLAIINEVQDVADNKDLAIKNGESIIDSVVSSNVVELKQDKNSFEKIKFRENVLKLENDFVNMIKDGVIDSTLEDCILTHHFSPVDEKYGCGTYAREMFIPKDTLIIGKIHRHQHLN
jgi:hypothetical protein